MPPHPAPLAAQPRTGFILSGTRAFYAEESGRLADSAARTNFAAPYSSQRAPSDAPGLILYGGLLASFAMPPYPGQSPAEPYAWPRARTG